MSSQTGSNKLPAHERFLSRRQEKKRKRSLEKAKKRKERAKERYHTRRYLFRQWLRQQYRRQKLPSGYFRRYSINHQCYLWIIERVAGALCGEHPGNLNTQGRRHERIFTYLNRHFYGMLQVPEAPSSDTELSEALKDEVGWMERQDYRQVVAIALWEKYRDLEKLPWSDKGRRNIAHRLKSYLFWTMREVGRQRCWEQKPEISTVQDAEWVEAREVESSILFFQWFLSRLTRRERYLIYLLFHEDISLSEALGMIYAGHTRAYLSTMQKLHSILCRDRKPNKSRDYFLNCLNLDELVKTKQVVRSDTNARSSTT